MTMNGVAPSCSAKPTSTTPPYRPPTRLALPLEPVSVSLKSEPMMFWKPEKVSLPAPPVAVPSARLAITAETASL